jgi:lysophospholipase L1-like esterase
MSCPKPIVVEATKPQGADVHFELPSPTGGLAPYSVACSPESDSEFPIGESSVGCTASDAAMVSTACAFSVHVRVSQTLARTRFTAFGDSITKGVVTLAPLVMLGLPDTYPSQLEQMLLGRYPTQAFVVTNKGKSGETTPRGALRLPGVLAADRETEVLLLLEGVNNVRGLSASTQERALESMILTARQADVDVIIATVMAVSPSYDAEHRGMMDAIRELNKRILGLADQHHI